MSAAHACKDRHTCTSALQAPVFVTLADVLEAKASPMGEPRVRMRGPERLLHKEYGYSRSEDVELKDLGCA